MSILSAKRVILKQEKEVKKTASSFLVSTSGRSLKISEKNLRTYIYYILNIIDLQVKKIMRKKIKKRLEKKNKCIYINNCLTGLTLFFVTARGSHWDRGVNVSRA